MTRLPDTMSGLLELTLNDMESLGPEYVLDMRSWHYLSDGQCHVCMAGAVMAQTLKASNKTTRVYYPDDFRPEMDKLQAIDQMRLGNFGEARRMMCIVPRDDVQTSWHVAMAYYPLTHMADWRRVVAELKEQGL